MSEGAATRTTGSPAGSDRLPLRIAVDGSAASGKSSIGRRLAQRLGYVFLDTGVMYRAVTWAALDRAIDLDDPRALTELAESLEIDVSVEDADGQTRIAIDGLDVSERLRSQDVEDNVSIVSRVAGVRESLVALQRGIAARQPIVMAGRDIGTVVLPKADLKIYLDASLEERARRRHADFVEAGHEASENAVLEDIRRRDRIDSEREVSPLRPAGDAVVVNTDGLSLEQVMSRVIGLVEAP
ncbi:MAG TPA: (d)CMP kinase [Dehalococcoidia bacterium]|nr:(d)CMP kinase [Dehalococcoidia bacterium]